MIDFSKFNSLLAMTMYFNSEEKCKKAIIETRWGAGRRQDVVWPLLRRTPLSQTKRRKVPLQPLQKQFFLQGRHHLRGHKPATRKVVHCNVPNHFT